MNNIKFGNKVINLSSPVFVIAEVGVNHILETKDLASIPLNSSLEVAFKLVDSAKKAGADAIKFQSFSAKKLQYNGISKPKYQKKNLSNKINISYFDLLKSLETSHEDQIKISNYCKKNAHPKVKRFIKVGNCKKLPYKDNSFDLVISISTIHNLEKKFIKQALNELIRVSKGSIFIRVKAFKNIRQKKFIDKWNLVAKSNLSEKQWIKLFKQVNFKGDYSFSKF